MHPDGAATGRLDQNFPWFPSVLRANGEFVPKIHVALHASLAALSRVQNFRQKAALQREHIFFIVLP